MDTICEKLLLWEQLCPDDIAYIIDSNNNSISYKELVAEIGNKISQLDDCKNHQCGLLLYEDVIDFLTTFLAFQFVGIIPIPMFYPKTNRHFRRLMNIFNDANTNLVVCSKGSFGRIKKNFLENGLQCQIVTFEKVCLPKSKLIPRPNPISFIQYTSGSTDNPKGVIITQTNLMHNQQLLTKIFHTTKSSMILSWLPFYHDMGLIGNLLHTIYMGCTCVILNSSSVFSNPLVWLRSIEKYKITHSGGPNFIYDLCTEKINKEELGNLDLSCWQVAYNGSEPIKKSTIDRFIDKFSISKFNSIALKTCYGLAEATLIVTGGNPKYYEDQISSGLINNEVEIILCDEKNDLVNNKIGEICISGLSVTSGYWKNDFSSFVEFDKKTFLKTGDLGRIIDDHLYIVGRIKEMLIVHGENLFPYDIENVISREIQGIASNGVAIVQFNNDIVVFAELERAYLNGDLEKYSDLTKSIDRILVEIIGMMSYDIILLSPRSLLRTSSGKIERNKLLSQKSLLNQVYSKNKSAEIKVNEVITNKTDIEDLEEYLFTLFKEKLAINNDSEIYSKKLIELGMSSIISMELLTIINRQLNIHLEVEAFFEFEDFNSIKEYIINIVWVNRSKIESLNQEEEIIL